MCVFLFIFFFRSSLLLTFRPLVLLGLQPRPVNWHTRIINLLVKIEWQQIPWNGKWINWNGTGDAWALQAFNSIQAECSGHRPMHYQAKRQVHWRIKLVTCRIGRYPPVNGICVSCHRTALATLPQFIVRILHFILILTELFLFTTAMKIWIPNFWRTFLENEGEFRPDFKKERMKKINETRIVLGRLQMRCKSHKFELRFDWNSRIKSIE